MDNFYSNELIERFEKMLDEQKIYFFDSEEFIEIIEYYLDFADIEFAFKALKVASEQYPQKIQLRVKWLEYFVCTKEFHEAQAIIEELDDIQYSDIDYLLAVAQYWSGKKNRKSAISFYELALEIGEEKDYILSSMGNEYLELDMPEKALECFLNSLKINPKDEFAFYSTIHCFEVSHRNKECIEFLKAYIDDLPYAESAWFQLGIKQFEEKEYTEAYQSFDFAIVINPESVVNYNQKALCLERLEYWEEALLVYQEALPFEDNKSLLMVNMAHCFQRLGNLQSALKMLLQAAKEDPQQDMIWFEISRVYEELGCFEEALHYAKKAVAMDEENVDFIKKQAYLHIKAQLFEEAMEDFEILLRLEPHRFSTHYAYSELLL